MQINSFNSKIFIEPTIGAGLSEAIDSLAPSRIFLVSDENTHTQCLPLIEELLSGQKVHETVIGQGEANKRLETVVQIWNHLQEEGADSRSLVIALGGGMLLDVAGFAAGTFKRGIPLIHVPTTLLSMVDASVGGKTGINFNGYKNHIGVFRAPDYVFIYPAFLKTLDHRQLYSGWAEMVKHGMIQSQRHFERLMMTRPDNLPDGEMALLIRDSVDIKNYYIASDPYDKGIRKVLNLGHTLGHALESLAMEKNQTLLHGEAVVHGLICEYSLSMKLLGAEPTPYQQLRSHVSKYYPNLQVRADDFPVIRRFLMQDKKNAHESINFTLLENISKPLIDQFIEWDEIESCLRKVAT
ncbi:MAG: 3-dehydroquinate synthase [Bacteroidales bacterium]|nr:3-dehydroquinate synthase [Bacteroidales bacterium]